MKVAMRILRAREARGLTQEELAKILGVTAGTVCAWETGRHGIRVGRLKAVARALEVEVSELVA